ncbi:hypothetical protein HanRHA438_Chr01g0002571 [Helianthus annuus]|nr:hypothetical protein HanRHA438_Chr01g0002571 [Helianthus annuus]
MHPTTSKRQSFTLQFCTTSGADLGYPLGGRAHPMDFFRLVYTQYVSLMKF